MSVKLTGLGLKLDEGLGFENVAAIVRCAEERDNFVRIDMEDSSTTTETLEIYRGLRSGGLDNVGVVLGAHEADLADIADLADLRPNVRVCKGIYVERRRSPSRTSTRFAQFRRGDRPRCLTLAPTSRLRVTTSG